MAKKTNEEQWISSAIIGALGGLTLFFVNSLLNQFVFHVKFDFMKTLLTAMVFAIVFTIVSRQWDKKKVKV